MRLIVEAIALLVIGTIVATIAALLLGRSPLKFADGGSALKLADGELRCEGAGAVIIEVDGKDYAVNGMASPRYPPIQTIWNPATVPQVNIDRLIVRGLTLCDWETAATK